MRIKPVIDFLLLILLIALLALPAASLGLSGYKPGANPQVAGSSTVQP